MPIIQLDKQEHAHYCIRIKFNSKNEEVKLRMSGRTQYIFYMDGTFAGDGPSRFPSKFPPVLIS